MHRYERQTERGFGSWQQCRDCGATFHHGHYWHAGRRSKSEPPCQAGHESAEYQQWLATAEAVPYPES